MGRGFEPHTSPQKNQGLSVSDPLGPFCFVVTQRSSRGVKIIDLVPDLLCFKNKPPPSVHRQGFETETRKQRFDA